MRTRFLATFFGLACFIVSTSFVSAQSLDIAETLPERLLFVVSGGYWTEEIEQNSETVQTRGYYRLSAFRREDNSSALFLQKIMLGENGPEAGLTLEIEEMMEMKAYVTDMRPESSTGGQNGEGFAAYVYLKEDPKLVEPETYSLYVDDLGDIYFEMASN